MQALLTDFPFQAITDIYVDRDAPLGHGANAEVFGAFWRGASVAVKVLYPVLVHESSQGRLDFLRSFLGGECAELRRLCHPNVVQFLGVCFVPWNPEIPALVTERLETTLRARYAVDPRLTEAEELRLLYDVTAGLSYIHSHQLIHRDLTTGNVLITTDGRAKIADVGVAKSLQQGSATGAPGIEMSSLSKCPGTLLYMSPEALRQPPKYDTKLDVFSFGVLTTAVLVRREPAYEVFMSYHNQCEFVDGRMRAIPEVRKRSTDINAIRLSHPLRSLILSCLSDSPHDRPSSTQLCRQLAEHTRAPTSRTSSGLASVRPESSRDEVLCKHCPATKRKHQEVHTQTLCLQSEVKMDWSHFYHIYFTKNSQLQEAVMQLRREKELLITGQTDLSHKQIGPVLADRDAELRKQEELQERLRAVSQEQEKILFERDQVDLNWEKPAGPLGPLSHVTMGATNADQQRTDAVLSQRSSDRRTARFSAALHHYKLQPFLPQPDLPFSKMWKSIPRPHIVERTSRQLIVTHRDVLYLLERDETSAGLLFRSTDPGTWTRCQLTYDIPRCLCLLSHKADLYCTAVPGGADVTTFLYKMEFCGGLPKSWSLESQCPMEHFIFESVFAFRDSFIFAGCQDSRCTTTYPTVWEYNISKREWLNWPRSSWPYLPQWLPVAGSTPVVTNNAVHLIGGVTKRNGLAKGSIDVLSMNIVNGWPIGQWHRAIVHLPRRCPAAAMFLGRLVIAGGCSNSEFKKDLLHDNCSTDCFVYDEETRAWCRLPSLTTKRSLGTLAVYKDCLFLAGGKSNNTDWNISIERWSVFC